MAFPNARILNMQYKAGWFKNDPTRLNIYVQYNYITPADFKSITGVEYITQSQVPTSNSNSASSESSGASTESQAPSSTSETPSSAPASAESNTTESSTTNQ